MDGYVCRERLAGPPKIACRIFGYNRDRTAVISVSPGKVAPAGSLCYVYLVVADLEAARNRLLERGVQVGEIRHKTPIGPWDGSFAPGLDPARGDYASFAEFSDPDGNIWVLQERGYHDVKKPTRAV